uniref:Uncharacterized protein LOC116948355 n=1 Tax=Petromyzon marinus TaxID=7757 RepID=A0AAJ7TQH0_PETMA|nr:uncharacterized protein LOC116948355 [Petromyzon marinus]
MPRGAVARGGEEESGGAQENGESRGSSPNNLASEAARTLSALPHAKIRHVFTGQGIPSWKTFARNVTRAKKINGWTDAQALEQLTIHLDGRAADYAEALPAGTQTQLAELMHQLDLRFGTRNEEEAKAALEARRRQPGEDLRDYAEDVRSLTQIARLGYTTEAIEDLAAEKIQRYLVRTMWWHPDLSGTRLPFNTLVERARKCERLASERAQLRGLGRERHRELAPRGGGGRGALQYRKGSGKGASRAPRDNPRMGSRATNRHGGYSRPGNPHTRGSAQKCEDHPVRDGRATLHSRGASRTGVPVGVRPRTAAYWKGERERTGGPLRGRPPGM